MESTRKPWFRPPQAGWNPRSYERYFGTPLGTPYRAQQEEAVFGFLSALWSPTTRSWRSDAEPGITRFP